MVPEDDGAEGLRRNGFGSCKPACGRHPRLREAAASRGFSVYRSCRAHRAAHRIVGRGYAAGW
jgi:hypothetical protein